MWNRGDRQYEPARRAILWNQRLPDRLPDTIVRPTTTDEVVEAVRRARERGSPIALASGGHSWCATPMRDGGTLIDLRNLDDFEIDPESRTASIGPAVKSAQLMEALRSKGLAFPGGHITSVALGGFLLAGGRGWNYDAWGPACFSVHAVDVVTANGELVHADREHHPDLLWAARGAGPTFFGVITRYHLDLYPAPRSIGKGSDLYPTELAANVMTWVEEVRPHWRGETRIFLTTARELLGHTDPVLSVSTTVFTDSTEETQARLDVLDECPVRSRALRSERDPDTSYEAIYQLRAGRYPDGYRWAADTVLAGADAVECLQALIEDMQWAPNPMAHILIALPRELIKTGPGSDGTVLPPEPGAALSVDGPFDVHVYSTWSDAADDPANLAWMDATMEALRPSAIGHYIGETDLTRWDAQDCFSSESWRRLCELRDEYDPGRVFHEPLARA